MRLRPRPAADAVAEPDRRRHLRVRRAEPSARAGRARAAERDPRPRPLGRLDGRRARGRPREARASAAPGSRLPVRACARRRVRVDRRRPLGADRGDERRRGRLPLRLRGASVPRGTRRPGGRHHAARACADRAAGRRARPPRRQRARGGRARLPHAEAGWGREARPLLHRPRARRGRAGARPPRRDDALGRRELSLPDDLHRRPAAGGRPAEPRGRADDVRAERLPEWRGLVRLEPGETHAGAWGIARR